MTLNDAIDYFGNASKLAHALAVKPQAIYQWTRIPAQHQWTIWMLSQFKLEPDVCLFPNEMKTALLSDGLTAKTPKVLELLSLANELAEQDKHAVIDALITMASHNRDNAS